MAVHMVHDLTCPKTVFHSLYISSTSFAYLALSRIRSHQDIVLTTPLHWKS
ncbi:hypothetical protein GQ600_5323 [Phytophthora cactorum]|nr:hypothetical protein GQ600_5323 [Phytophthora cactorum]